MIATLVSSVPFAHEEPVNILDLGSGDGRLAEALLTVFPRAMLTALDVSESMRRETTRRLALFGGRARGRLRRRRARLVVWLRHAGFAAVDCVWMHAAHAVFGGFKQAGASAAPLRVDS